MKPKRRQSTYDHRLIRLVQNTGDITIATGLGIPRSMAAGWIRRAPCPVTTAAGLDDSAANLRARVARLERRVCRLMATLRIVFALLRVLRPDLARMRIPEGRDKFRLLHAIDQSHGVRGLRRLLHAIGLSPSRLSAWRRAALSCELDDQPSCPNSSPHQLTVDEVSKIREMITSPDYRHVPTGRLAMLAQRLGRVIASPTTWYRLVRMYGWRRPRLRIHPEKPTEGIRASKPNEIWHVDTTVIRLLHGTRAYLHAVIDNFSRRILAWRVHDRFEPGNTAAVLIEAGRAVEQSESRPTVLADGGVENYNSAVNELVSSGMLRRLLAMTEILFSNALIEAWWRVLKHQWLYLHQLDSVARVRGLVCFYVAEHNSKLPHSAFRGQTPDEIYFGTSDDVPAKLVDARQAARQARLDVNRARRCAVCA